jgi:hypothetical protein
MLARGITVVHNVVSDSFIYFTSAFLEPSPHGVDIEIYYRNNQYISQCRRYEVPGLFVNETPRCTDYFYSIFLCHLHESTRACYTRCIARITMVEAPSLYLTNIIFQLDY